MIEKLDEKNLKKNDENELLSYIFEFVPKHFSEIEFDENDEPIIIPCQSQILTFKKRYNAQQLYGRFKYSDYKADKDIQSNIMAFGLDPERFWYLLLFIHDYCCGACLNTIRANESAVDNVKSLISIIGESMIDKTAGKPTFKQETQLVFQSGKKKIKINNAFALQYLIECCTFGMEKMEPKLIHTMKVLERSDDETNTNMICFFTKNMLSFFNEHQVKQTKDASIYSKKMLISRLVYFGRISKNEKFKYDIDTLKGYLSKCDLPNLEFINKDYL